jgi:hypothetical protein
MDASPKGVRRIVRPAVLSGIALLIGALAFSLTTMTANAQTTVLTVAANGNDSNSGSLSAPLRTVQRAVDLAGPGTTIQIRGGTYAPSTNIRIIGKNGTSSQPITMRSYNGEKVVIDGDNMPHTPAPLGGSIPRRERGAIHVDANWWRFIDIEITNGPYGVFCVDCNNNVFDRLITRDNYETGLHIQNASSNNQVINLDSYGNRDPRKNGESADGLAIKEGSGTGNVVRGARLWNNADDGFDTWEFLSPILVENSLAWGNGFNRWGFQNFDGDGNGFKLGRGGSGATHTLRNNMAFQNAVDGFIDNGNPASMRLENNTAWNNGRNGFVFNRSTSTLNRNLSVGNGVNLGSSGGSGNSWQITSSWSNSDLMTTNSTKITGPRRASGAQPVTDFLRPVNYANLGANFGSGAIAS